MTHLHAAAIDIYPLLQEDIIAAVENVCYVFPSSDRAKCDAFIQKYGPEIIKLLVSDAGPEVICMMLTLCATETRHVSGKCPHLYRSSQYVNCFQCIITY